MEGMSFLRSEIESWDAFFGVRLREERGNRDIDPWGRWCGHCVRCVQIPSPEVSATMLLYLMLSCGGRISAATCGILSAMMFVIARGCFSQVVRTVPSRLRIYGLSR